MVVTSQFVLVLVWKNPSNGMDIKMPSGGTPDIMDES
jgi:hypothetical protein